MKLYIGLPLPGGALLDAADRLGAPILLSVNCFTRSWKRADRWRLPFPSFRAPSLRLVTRGGVALDSGGFVFMRLHNGHPFTPEEYVAWVAGGFGKNLDWWSQLDACCEPEVAGDRKEVRLRVAHTAHLYAVCAREAACHDIAPPMPVLQGFRLDDYSYAIDCMPLSSWPDLVGLGSVCRRARRGPDGLETILNGLDRLLPANVKLHVFGGKTMGSLALHPRVASADSQAWDFRARKLRPTGRDMAFRASVMERWYARQMAAIATAAPYDFQDAEPLPVQPDTRHRTLNEITALVAEGELDYGAVTERMLQEWKALDDGSEEGTAGGNGTYPGEEADADLLP